MDTTLAESISSFPVLPVQLFSLLWRPAPGGYLSGLNYLEKRQEALPEAQIGQKKLLQIVEAQALEIKALQVKLEAQSERLETLEKLKVNSLKRSETFQRPILREVYQRRREAQEVLPGHFTPTQLKNPAILLAQGGRKGGAGHTPRPLHTSFL